MAEEDEDRPQSRPRSLRLQFQQHQSQLAGLQECPAYENHARDDFIILGSGAGRILGCCLLINARLPRGQGPKGLLHFQRSQVKNFYSEERVLIVRLRTHAADHVIYVMHAPYQGHPFLDPERWWKDLSAL